MAAGKKTAPDKQERVFATYMATGSYRETSRKVGIPTRSVWDIVQRLGGDELAEMRLAQRALLVEKVWERIDELLPAVNLANLGVEGRTSVGLEAAKALDSLARVLAVASPDMQQDVAPTTINVNVDMAPPRDHPLALAAASTTTTLDELS